ncbi:polysaccharide deacetylase family protein [Pseudonocardia charpentierae]|uniref:Polysaccharide deacetylase family protein n=1 Tax=Pseudonocardia charpentierae TaxID=3075545 RepID=A0ABU2N7A5_9PSEU|nr:polysaccharide deacetylase family protein [Pseudonocardia sp. DSM 45834]MDT0349821.1 polysaccharide deacetylase family protein [Pseudonocardia sp. DSM 45834]
MAQLSVDHADPHPVDERRTPVLAADGRRLVPVLTYHSVSDDPPGPIRRWSVTPARLRAHLTALRHAGFTGLTVTELLACYRGTRTLPERPVVLTFDDGYEDFLLEALPALTDAGFPSTLYASSGLLRDEKSAAQRPGRMLDWGQLGEVAAAGVEIGAHSHTHRELDTLSRREAAWEVEHSGQRLRDELGLPVSTFAYPYGYSNRDVRAAVRDAGYDAACGVKNAYSHTGDDRWALSRILVERDLDTAALTRLVTWPVLPIGWRRERPRTVAWRTYRRARALTLAARGGATPVALNGHVPVAVLDVELALPLPPLDARRPADVLVRLHGRPLGRVRVDAGGSLADSVVEHLGSAVGQHLADDGLPPTDEAPGVPEQHGPPWPCHRAPAALTRSTSVVIPTVGRPRYVVDLVHSLLAGDVAPDEVIVVDNRPADTATATVLDRDFADEPRVHYLAEPVAGASLARNAGLRAARSDLVAFLDDDVVADRGWLASVHEAWDAVPDVGAVTGLILPTELETHGQQLVQAYGGFDKGFTRRVFDLDEHRLAHPLYPYLVGAYGSGANAVFDRAGITALGGFDTRLGPGTPTKAGEDLDVLLRTVLGGRAIVYEPAALVRHHHRRDDTGLRTMAYDYGIGLSALFVKHLVTDPRSLLSIGRRVPAGLRLLLAPDSTRNANRREAHYPTELTVRELLGIAAGPLAFARSARRARSRVRP